MKNIWLVRHAETDFNTQRIIQGNSDSPIASIGYQQTKCLANFFEAKKLDIIYCSDLKRAVITASEIANLKHGVKVVQDPIIRERAFGIYEGKKFDDYLEVVGASHQQLDFRPEGAESLLDVCARVQKLINRLTGSEEENILIVGHGAYNRCFLATVLQDPEQVHQIKQSNCCVNKLKYDAQEGLQAEMINFVDHLIY